MKILTTIYKKKWNQNLNLKKEKKSKTKNLGWEYIPFFSFFFWGVFLINIICYIPFIWEDLGGDMTHKSQLIVKSTLVRLFREDNQLVYNSYFSCLNKINGRIKNNFYFV